MRETTSGATARSALQHFAQHAVDAEAHHQPVLERLDVDVGGVFLHRLREHGVDEPDDRRVVFALEQVGLLGQILREMREVGGFFDAVGGLHGVVAGFVGLAQQRVECGLFDLLEPQRNAEIAAHFGDRERRGAGPVDALGDAVVHAVDEHAVALGEREADALRTDRPRASAASFMAWAACLRAVRRRGAGRAVVRRRAVRSGRRRVVGPAAAASGGSSGSLLNGSSGSIRLGPRRPARCSSRM